MNTRPPRFHRTAREACPVSRACPIEHTPARHSRASWLIALAVVGAVAMVVIHLSR